MSRLRLALVLILLSLTSLDCASGARVESPSTTADASGPRGSREAFTAHGIDAPATESAPRARDGTLDIAAMSEAVGEAKEVSPEALAALERRGGQGEPRPVRRTPASSEPRSYMESTSAGDQREAQAADDERRARAAAEEQSVRRAEAERQAIAPRVERETIEVFHGGGTPPGKDSADASKAEAKKGKAGAKGGIDLQEAVRAQPSPKTDTFGEGGASGSLGDAFSGVVGLDRDGPADAKPKARDAEGTNKGEAPKTVLPAVTRGASVGKILVTGESGHLEALVPRAVRAVAYVQGPRARTIVDLVFENPHDRRLEGSFYYPLPADASPAGFAMFEGTRRVAGESLFQSAVMLPDLPSAVPSPEAFSETAPARGRRSIDWGVRKDARVVEQVRAREVYEDIVRKNIDPALLEWSGGSNFQARVFPLEPRSLKRIVIAYEQPLVFDGRAFRYDYAFPSSPSLKQRLGTLFVDGGHGTVTARPPKAKETKAGRWTRFDVDAGRTGEAVLSAAIEPGSSSPVLRGRDPAGLGGDSFYTEVRPKIARGDETPTGRAIFLVDTSLSSEEDGAHARRAKLIEALLARDTTIKEYAVGLFDLRVRWLHKVGWRPNTEANRRATADELRRVYLEGATSFAGVLSELERQRGWAVDGQKTTVFLLSDGEITWGLDKVEALAARYPVLRDVRWITYRFGESPVNQTLFDLLSNETAGRTVTLLSEAEVPEAALAHRAEPAVLEGVAVKGARSVDLVVAGEPRLVFPGQTLRIAGRLPAGGAASVVVELRTGAKRETLEVPLGAGGDDGFAPRAWAELHTHRLIGLDDVRLDRLVVALSQHYRLANARASFLVLDSEAQVKDYALADESIDLASLELARRREEDQRRDRLLGVALDDVPQAGKSVVALLHRRTDGLRAMVSPQPLVDAPFAGGEERVAAEVDYRKARAAEPRDYLVYDRIARMRALSGDTAGAVRALSSAVEVAPRDSESMRLVGYALLALAQYDVAAELFERLRLLRPFEPEVFLEEAFALESTGRFDLAARNYEILLAKEWPRHLDQARVTGAFHYARLLDLLARERSLEKAEAAELTKRKVSVLELTGVAGAGAPIDHQLTTFWSTDSVDVDLWVYDPSGEKCYYGHKDTATGARLYWDVTDGLGPELFQAQHASAGKYDALVHFYGSRAPRLQAPTALLLVVDRGLFTPNAAASRKFQLRLLPKKDAVLLVRTDTF